jgi:hypothetical protein
MIANKACSPLVARGAVKSLLVSIVLVFTTGCVTTPKAQAVVKGLDTFGSKRISAEEVSRQYGPMIHDWVLAGKNQKPEYQDLKNEIEAAIKNQYGFAYVSLSLITYFAPYSGDYLTVDVVEPEDVGQRMAFLPDPKGKFEDPDGLIALWDQYLQLAFELQRSGQFEYPKSCPAWHCTHGFENPKLAPFLKKFNRLVPPNEKILARILKEDSRPEFRGNAAFLLAHIKGGESVVKYVLASVTDSSELVRNNAVRVLSDIAMKHPDIEIPVEPILQVLNFPAATDRNKAGYTLASLSLKEKNKKPILSKAGTILLAMLKLEQPNNHDPAYTILKNISGETFGARDYDSWESWINARLTRGSE